MNGNTTIKTFLTFEPLLQSFSFIFRVIAFGGYAGLSIKNINLALCLDNPIGIKELLFVLIGIVIRDGKIFASGVAVFIPPDNTLIFRRLKEVDKRFFVPDRKDIDTKLVLGAAGLILLLLTGAVNLFYRGFSVSELK